MLKEHFYYSKTAILTLRRFTSYPSFCVQNVYSAMSFGFLVFPFCFRVVVMLTLSLPLCPLTQTHMTSQGSGGGKLIEALLVNCIKEKPKNSSPQSWPMLPFDPLLPQAFVGGHICGFATTYIFAI